MKKLLLILALAGGCAGPADERPDPPPISEGTPSPAPAVQEIPAGPLTLEKAMALAVRLHPELSIAQARVDAAEGRSAQAGLWLNPDLIVGAERLTEDEELLAGFGLRLPIGGRLGAAVHVEELDRERLRFEAEAVRLEIRARVHGAFATALFADEARRFQREAQTAAQSAVTIAKARLAAGDALAEEVARVEMEEVRARLDGDRAEGLLDLAMLGLAAAIGHPKSVGARLEGSLESTLELPALERLLARLSESPRLAAAEADIATHRARTELAESERIPDLSLELLYRRDSENDVNTMDAGVAIALPLFNRNQGKLRETRAGEAAAEAQARATRLDVERQVREAHIRLARALAQARLLREEIVPRSEVVWTAYEKRYNAGDVSLAEVLPMRRDRSQLRLTYLESLREAMESWSDLKRVLPETK
jgi:cobalt-zinc-cadmium efflux system outer membrane protein